MKKWCIVVLSLASCQASLGQESRRGEPPAPVQHAEWLRDAESFQNFDFLVCGNECYVARMVEPPSEATGGKGQFVLLFNDQEVSTERYYKIRPFADGDHLRVGEMIAWREGQGGTALAPPASREEAIRSLFMVATITDLNDAFSRGVHVRSRHGERRVDVTNVHVVMRE